MVLRYFANDVNIIGCLTVSCVVIDVFALRLMICLDLHRFATKDKKNTFYCYYI